MPRTRKFRANRAMKGGATCYSRNLRKTGNCSNNNSGEIEFTTDDIGKRITYITDGADNMSYDGKMQVNTVGEPIVTQNTDEPQMPKPVRQNGFVGENTATAHNTMTSFLGRFFRKPAAAAGGSRKASRKSSRKSSRKASRKAYRKAYRKSSRK
jgi:hypothetical protein